LKKTLDPKTTARQKPRITSRWWQIAAFLLCATLLAAGLTLARRSPASSAESTSGTLNFGGRLTPPVTVPRTTRLSLEAQRVSESRQNADGSITPG
jgi:hypothetical protein